MTNEFVYTHDDGGDLCDRLTPRLIADRTVPVAHRNLYEVITPQPDAIHVIRKLLTWIEAFDMAFSRGDVRPEFKTAEGERIFLDEDRKWWLTDVQQRRKPDEGHLADEDGPASECDGEKDETDDEDPPSEEECNDTAMPAPRYTSGRPVWAQARERPSPL